MSHAQIILAAACLGMPLAAGCGSSTSVTGTVTYED